MKIERPKVESSLAYAQLKSGRVYSIVGSSNENGEVLLKCYDGHVYLESGGYYASKNSILATNPSTRFVELNAKLVIED